MNLEANPQEDSEKRRTWIRAWGLRLALILASVLWLMLVASSWANAANTKDDPDDYSFKWLDPEKKIYVLQNRRYSKADHAVLTAMGGYGLSDTYRTRFNFDGRLAYFFREDWGVEFFMARSLSNSGNTAFKAVQTATSGTLNPGVREIRGQYGATVNWVPFYSKINVFNKILYFDWYFNAGAGSINSAVDTSSNASGNYVMQDLFAVFLGTGHQYYLNESWMVRLDFSAGIYQATVPIPSSTDTAWWSNFNFNVGVGLRI